MELTERLDNHLQNIREDNSIRQEVDKILIDAKDLFNKNDSNGWGDQIPKALKLLELVAIEDLKAKSEGRKFNPHNVRIDIKQIAPDPVTYAKDRGFWDGGDDEDYSVCCFDYGGDGDVIQIAKKYLSKEAKYFIEDVVDKAMRISWDKMRKAYDRGEFAKINGWQGAKTREKRWAKLVKDHGAEMQAELEKLKK
jgi:hypothetical protein